MKEHLCIECLRETCPNAGYDTGITKCTVYIQPKPQTNADRIRNMSDEELAEILHSLKNKCGGCPVAKSNVFCSTFPTCKDAWLAWLKQETEEKN